MDETSIIDNALKRMKVPKRGGLSKDGKVYVRRASPKSLELVKAILKEYRKTRDIILSCKNVGVAYTTFYYYVNAYVECRRLANKVGLCLRDEDDIFIVGSKKNRSQKILDMLNISYRNTWSDEEKEEIIKRICDSLEIGTDLINSVFKANVPIKIVAEWMKEDELIHYRIQQAMSKDETKKKAFADNCVMKSMSIAAQKGMVSEVLRAAEKISPEKWGEKGSENGLQKLIGPSNDVIDAEMEIEEI